MRSHQISARLPAVAVGMFLGTAVALLVGVSLFVHGPEPSGSTPGQGIGTAVTPTVLSSVLSH